MHAYTTTPAQRLAELRRDLATKIRQHPAWVREKHLTHAAADQRLAATRDALADLEQLHAPTQTPVPSAVPDTSMVKSKSSSQ
ncbi:hypothetical protein [Hymenobacter psychrotolerans]|uniref:Uncharacterized protein n=1 Tax=Hymenobacter psychrotolerans DSM 18569 TaxID=1121959 RepID=A0A1M6UNY6_9BACT|nr:hypothetical protein [Hymenobacter psychrotolerans]SHK70870.1 hypothetical protein SAMN02746009_01427 [Hymenobacter psychrotolerans DSM 18569]